MLRTNLSTRPFYNEQAVQTVIVVAVVLVAAATVFNVLRVVSLTARERTVAGEIQAGEQQAAVLRTQAARERSRLDTRRVAEVAAASREVNQLIDGRVFSWTGLFNQFEATLPPDVRITAVGQTIDDDDRRVVAMMVVARSVAGIDRFLDALEKTGEFSAMLVRSERETEDGLIEANIQGYYEPRTGAPADAAPPAVAEAAVEEKTEPEARR